MPDATSLHHCLQLYYLELNSGIENWPLINLALSRVVKYMPFPFYIASVVLFKLRGCVVSHMQVLATPLLSVILNTHFA